MLLQEELHPSTRDSLQAYLIATMREQLDWPAFERAVMSKKNMVKSSETWWSKMRRTMERGL